MQLFKVRIGGGSPLERLAVRVVGGDEVINALHELFQVQADHIAQLLDEERVVGELEALGAMRLQAKELEVALHARLGDASLGRHRAHAPVRRAVGRLGVQCGLDQMRHAFVIDRARFARANIVVQACNASLDKPGSRSSSVSSNSTFGLPLLMAVSPFRRYRIGMDD